MWGGLFYCRHILSKMAEKDLVLSFFIGLSQLVSEMLQL